MDDFNPYQPVLEVSHDPTRFDGGVAPLATRLERFVGAFIDGFLQLILVFPIAIGLGVALGLTVSNQFLLNVLSTVGGFVIGACVFLLLNGYLLATQGRTIGKLLLKTRIVDRETNQIPPFWPLFLKRYAWIMLLAMIPIISFVFFLVDALLIFRESRACLHDDVAGTKVIKG